MNYTLLRKTDSIAYNEVSKRLQIIKDFLDNDSLPQKVSNIPATIHFLTELTGIGSESDGNYAGQFNPTYKDYLSWLKWLSDNKQNIVFDSKTRAIVFRNRQQPFLNYY